MYGANFLRVLLRIGLPYMSTWGMEMLVTKIGDKTKSVAMAALSILSEACENEVSNCFSCKSFDNAHTIIYTWSTNNYHYPLVRN